MSDNDQPHALAGRFIVFDGPDGSGKSTQLARFDKHLNDSGLNVCRVREPGGTTVGEAVRNVLLDRDHDDMTLRTEMLLYMASRAQLCETVIAPALASGSVVISDRFLSSTLAYQGTAGGLDLQHIRDVGSIATGNVMPDLTVIFDVDEHTARSRLAGTPPKPGRRKGATADTGPSLFADRMEDKGWAYQQRVREGYLEQADAEPERYAVIDARDDEDAVFERALAAVHDRLSTPA
ncbi:MAG: dTMP kinase [Planctomycetota bacterium]